jgi:hypothetical protein
MYLIGIRRHGRRSASHRFSLKQQQSKRKESNKKQQK